MYKIENTSSIKPFHMGLDIKYIVCVQNVCNWLIISINLLQVAKFYEYGLLYYHYLFSVSQRSVFLPTGEKIERVIIFQLNRRKDKRRIKRNWHFSLSLSKQNVVFVLFDSRRWMTIIQSHFTTVGDRPLFYGI